MRTRPGQSSTHRSTRSSRRALSAWLITLAATAASTYALDVVATAAGVLLVASRLLSGLDHTVALAFLAGTYVLWGVGLRANLRANWSLLRLTGTSTNVLSKAAFELTGRRGPRTQRVAAGAGYVATELAKEAPYYAGAFGAAAVTDSVSTNDALIFLAGTNLGAAAYEYVLARPTRRLLRRRYAPPDADYVPQEYQADYCRVAEPDERETTAVLADATIGDAIAVAGAEPKLHHVVLARVTSNEHIMIAVETGGFRRSRRRHLLRTSNRRLVGRQPRARFGGNAAIWVGRHRRRAGAAPLQRLS